MSICLSVHSPFSFLVHILCDNCRRFIVFLGVSCDILIQKSIVWAVQQKLRRRNESE